MADAPTEAPASPGAEERPDTLVKKRPGTRSSFAVRPWVRAAHRDLGYLAVGLTLVYATSGLAVNHLTDWKDGDANFSSYSVDVDTGPLPPKTGDSTKDDEAVAAAVAKRLGITVAPREVYRVDATKVDVTFERRTLHIDEARQVVTDEGQKPRFFLRIANWLHLNRGKKQWTYFADAYAAGLLVLAISGLFMIPGKKGLLGRGAVLVGVGIAVPVLYVVLSGGP
jgi:hypothetical protein